MATRFGSLSFRHQFVQNLLEKSWRRGAWQAWGNEREDVLESEHPTQYYISAFRGQRAVRAAFLGDIPTAHAELQAAIDVVADLKNSATITAYPALIRSWVMLAEGGVREAAEQAAMASTNTNFTMEGSYLLLLAACAAGDVEHMDRAVAAFRDPIWHGAVTDALLVVSETLRAARAGSDGPAEGEMVDALRTLEDGEDLLYAHLGALLWVEIAPESAAARTAGDSAAAFFAERRASGLVERLRASVVRAAAIDG